VAQLQQKVRNLEAVLSESKDSATLQKQIAQLKQLIKELELRIEELEKELAAKAEGPPHDDHDYEPEPEPPEPELDVYDQLRDIFDKHDADDTETLDKQELVECLKDIYRTLAHKQHSDVSIAKMLGEKEEEIIMGNDLDHAEVTFEKLLEILLAETAHFKEILSPEDYRKLLDYVNAHGVTKRIPIPAVFHPLKEKFDIHDLDHDQTLDKQELINCMKDCYRTLAHLSRSEKTIAKMLGEDQEKQIIGNDLEYAEVSFEKFLQILMSPAAKFWDVMKPKDYARLQQYVHDELGIPRVEGEVDKAVIPTDLEADLMEAFNQIDTEGADMVPRLDLREQIDTFIPTCSAVQQLSDTIRGLDAMIVEREEYEDIVSGWLAQF